MRRNKHFSVVALFLLYFSAWLSKTPWVNLSTTWVFLLHRNNPHILHQRAFCHAVKRSCTFPFSLITIFLWLSKEKSINQSRKCVLPFRHKNNRSISQQIVFCPF